MQSAASAQLASPILYVLKSIAPLLNADKFLLLYLWECLTVLLEASGELNLGNTLCSFTRGPAIELDFHLSHSLYTCLQWLT